MKFSVNIRWDRVWRVPVIYDVLFVRPCGDVDRLCDICLPEEINVEN